MLHDFITGLLAFLGYYVLMVIILFSTKIVFRIHGEPFRKMLHIAAAFSIFVLLHAFETWYHAAGSVLLFAVIVYVAVSLVEGFPFIMQLLEQRHTGEIRRSLVIVCIMMASLIALFWGGIGRDHQYIISTSVMAWGFGDAAAAIVGKRWGKHRLNYRWADGLKTWEGTIAMFLFAFIAMIVTLRLYTPFPFFICVLFALVAAPVSAFVEVISRGGSDTITVPYSAAIVLFGLTVLFSFMELIT